MTIYNMSEFQHVAFLDAKNYEALAVTLPRPSIRKLQGEAFPPFFSRGCLHLARSFIVLERLCSLNRHPAGFLLKTWSEGVEARF